MPRIIILRFAPSALALITLFALSALASRCPGQHHTAGWSFIGDANAATLYPVAVGHIDSAGKLTTILPFSKLAQLNHAHGGALDADDRSYVVAILSNINNGKLLRVSRSGTVLQAVKVLKSAPPGGGFVYDVMVDQNGDYITVVGPPTAAQKACLLRVDRGGKITTVFNGSNIGLGSCVITDIDTGDFLLLDKPQKTVYRIPANGSAVTSVGVFSAAKYLNDQLAQRISTGDLYAGSWAYQQAVLVRLNRAGKSNIALGSGLYGAYGIHLDRASAANPRIAVGSTSWDSGLFFMDLKTKAITTLFSSNTGFPLVYHKIFPNREVGTLRAATGQWDVYLHFAGEGGLSYVVGLGLSGVRPGLPLADGRRIFFNADKLTAMSLDGRLWPLLTGNIGVLDAAGHATARIDVSRLPPLQGLTIWLQTVTLHASAPLGIRTIADPVVLRL